MTAEADTDLKAPPPGAEPSEADLWRALKEDNAWQARDQLFRLHEPFARAIARKHHRERGGAGVELNELRQLAFVGLLEAIDHYRPELGVPFRGYAGKRVSGAVIDGLAKLSEAHEQVSFRIRWRRERLRSLADADVGELAGKEAMQALADLAVGLAIGFMLEGSGLYVDSSRPVQEANAYESLAWREVVRHVSVELDRLGEREQLIIRRHYVDGMTFDQIGQILSLSKGRISQLHRAAIARLRSRLPGSNPFHVER